MSIENSIHVMVFYFLFKQRKIVCYQQQFQIFKQSESQKYKKGPFTAFEFVWSSRKRLDFTDLPTRTVCSRVAIVPQTYYLKQQIIISKMICDRTRHVFAV